MTVAIDLGNTRAKAAFFNERKLLEVVEGLLPEELPAWVGERKPSAAIISSVSVPAEGLKQELERICPCLVLDARLAVPVKKLYKTPETLGADRLAAAVGGWSLFPGEAVLVVDAGTCIKYDYVDQQGNYRGGAISPGLRMRFKALHNFTARLPLVDHVPEDVPLLGQDTEGSVCSGVLNGSLAEIEGIISRFENDFGPARVIICGGDIKFFETKIKQPIFVSPALVLIGLNEILLHNAPDK